MDGITPVAAEIQPPQSGMGQLSSLLNLAQQSQNLQTGAFRQQEAQAGAVQAQQNARETQAAAQLLSDPIGNGILEADGKTPTKNAQSIIMRTMPTTGATRFGDIVTAAQHKVDFDNAKMNLNLNERQAFGSMVAGASAGATSPDEVREAVDNFLGAVKGSPVEEHFQTLADTFNKALDHVSTKPTIPGQPEPWRQLGAQYGRAVLGAPATVGAGGIGLPGATTNAAGQIINRKPISGELGAPPIAGAAPMPPSAINPTTPTVAAATTGATGGAGRDVDRANTVSSSQRDAAALLPLTQEVDRLSHEISASAIAGRVTEGLKNLGFTDVANARTQLNKDLGLLKGPLAARAGSDSRASSILEGYPTDQTPENTTHAAMDYIRGTFRQTMARGQLLKKHGQEGFAAADDELTRSTDPLVYEASSLKPGKSNGFYRRNFGSPEEAQAFKDRVDALKKHTSYIGSGE